MDVEFDDTLQWLGRAGHRIMIWDGHEERHVAVVDPDDWFDWLQQARLPLDILRPFPEGSFTIMPPIQPSLEGLLGAA